MTTVSASNARQTLPAQLDRVERGEEVEITRHGRVVAVLVRPDVLQARRATQAWADADRVGSLLEAALADALKPPAISAERADALVANMRSAREAR